MAPKLEAHFVDTAPEGSVVVIDAPPGQSQFSDLHPHLLMEGQTLKVRSGAGSCLLVHLRAVQLVSLFLADAEI
jgi:hypothetical protein